MVATFGRNSNAERRALDSQAGSAYIGRETALKAPFKGTIEGNI